MNKTNFLQLDGHILRCFLVILEEGSVSRAAERLDVTQSAVSHTLAKLRLLLGDPLFVRAGQGLTATERALSLKAPVQAALDNLQVLMDQRPFDPRAEELRFVVAANDMQRDLIFPDLVRSVRKEGVKLSLELKPSGVPSVSLLRDNLCDLIVTPLPPDAPDLIQHKLFSGNMMCFFDASYTEPPSSIESYLAAEHVTVQFVLGGGSNDVLQSTELPYAPAPTITVSNFAGIPSFIKGTEMLSTQLEFMHLSSLKELAMAPLPFTAEPLSIYMVWHERSQNDPAHKWLREKVKQASNGINAT